MLTGALILVGCGDPAANEACEQLKEYEQRIIDADATDDGVSDLLATTYDDVSQLADTTDGELGAALSELQPLLEKLGALTGDDEAAATRAQDELAALSEAEIAAMDDAADFVNETCDLSVLL